MKGKEALQQVAADYDRQAERIDELEQDLRSIKAAFEDNNRAAYDEGFAQGRSYQAIISVRADANFIDTLQKSLCEKCKKAILSQRP